MTEPTTTDNSIDLDGLFETSKFNDLMPSSYIRALIVRLRAAEAALTEIQTNWTKQGKTQDLKVGRIAELEAKLAAAEMRLRQAGFDG